jgi:hypothetical protein
MDLSLAEIAEAEATFELAASAPARAADALGIACCRIGGGVAVMMRNDPTHYWSKALGLGFREPVTAALIRHLCAFYREHGVPDFVLQLAHSVLPAGWDGICAANLLCEGNRWLKLVHRLTDIAPAPATAPAVTLVTPDEAGQWAGVLIRGFGMPGGPLVDMLAATVGRPGFRAYAAWEGDEMTGAANMYYYQDVAQFTGAATLPGRRRRGAQAALLAARLRDARAAGCREAFAETRQELGRRNPSLHNMRRAGFDVLYERVNWLWRPPATAPLPLPVLAAG